MNTMFLLLDSSQFNEDLTGLTNTNNKLWKNWAEVLLKNWNVSFKIVKTPLEFVLQVYIELNICYWKVLSVR